ncbi:MAG: GatB/YqeY domain-containing protein [Rhodospirillales bacterium]|nr:GatB/YqeY domain-containing protein [Rhodospirillales bacterium]
MLRERFTEALKTAMKDKDQRTVSTVRLMISKLKERDIEARAKGNAAGIGDAEIQQMLLGMIKQRRESIELYEKGGRAELAQQEREEIAVIERFLPQQMDEAAMEAAIKAVIAELGAGSVKDMGRIMAVLKERHSGSMDFSKAGPIAKRLLG